MHLPAFVAHLIISQMPIVHLIVYLSSPKVHTVDLVAHTRKIEAHMKNLVVHTMDILLHLIIFLEHLSGAFETHPYPEQIFKIQQLIQIPI